MKDEKGPSESIPSMMKSLTTFISPLSECTWKEVVLDNNWLWKEAKLDSDACSQAKVRDSLC